MEAISKLEIQLLALRDAADSALIELEQIKAETHRADQNKDNISRHLNMLNTKSWGKLKTTEKKNHEKKKPN
ncbi:MAG: hypothetical protein WC756_03545 [Taibaiella sp.]|jgi:hypothetical protein